MSVEVRERAGSDVRAQVRMLFAERLFLIGCFAIPLMMDFFGQAPYYGLIDRLYPATTLGALLLLGFMALLLATTPDRSTLRDLGGTWGRRVLMFVCVLPVPFAFRLMGGTPSPAIWMFMAVFGLVFIALWVWNPPSLLPFFGLALALSLLMRLRFVNAFPLNPEHADMLPLIVKANETFLGGQQPYIFYSMPWVIPLSYLPLMWLGYLPAVVLGLDVRWVNLLAEAGIVALFLAFVLPARRTPEINPALGYATFLLVLPTSMFYDAFTSHQILWLWIVLAVALLLWQHPWGWSAAAGLALATLQLAVVWLPVCAVYLWRNFGAKRAILYVGGAVALAGLIMLPFAWHSPRDFLDMTVLFYGDLSRLGAAQWAREQRWLYLLGFTAEAWRVGWQDGLKFLQGALLVALAGLFAIKYRANRVNLMRLVILSFGLFLLFSPLVAVYYHLVWLVLLAFYLAVLARA